MEIVFAKRLIMARKMKGFSIQELAGESGISKQSISLYEKGDMMPSSENMIRLAGSLGVDINFFFRRAKSSDIVLAGNIHFREKETIDNSELEIIKLNAIEFLERYFELERLADDRMEFSNPLENISIRDKHDAKKAAKLIRKKWKFGNTGLNNILSILETKGIKIVEIDASENFNGFAAWTGSVPIIVVNLNFNEITRIRFTTLHELGHLVLEVAEGLEDEQIERICDAFASELLLPVDMLVFQIGNNRTRISFGELRAIKEKYGISVKAILVNLAMNEIISWNHYYECKSKYNEHFENDDKVFGEYSGIESTTRFDHLLLKCLSEEKISMNKAISLSRISNKELSEKIDDAHSIIF